MNGARHRFSGPSRRFQWALETFLIFVAPLSGSRRSSSLKSTALPFAWRFSARFLVVSIKTFCDDGMPQRAIASSRPPLPLRTIGAG